MKKTVEVDKIRIGQGAPLVIIAGPCVIESETLAFETAAFLKDLTHELHIPFIFKASFDKANRTSIHSFRGPGIKKGLEILAKIKAELEIPILSDVHEIDQILNAAEVLDVIQIPAFLCRQTNFLLAAAGTGKPINVKKGQFIAPWDTANIAAKIESAGNHQILFTERGTVFGYNNLVVDFRSIKIMQDTGSPVIFDATHSVQLPGGSGDKSSGQREFAPILARAAVATGADAVFFEVHPNPNKALCDGPNSLPLDQLRTLFAQLKNIRQALK